MVKHFLHFKKKKKKFAKFQLKKTFQCVYRVEKRNGKLFSVAQTQLGTGKMDGGGITIISNTCSTKVWKQLTQIL